MYKIKINREKCKAKECGSLCEKVCPENWKIFDNKAHVIRFKVREVGCNKKAMEICPFKAIKIEKI